ncbi:unnamed protein product [Ranitomeya imitator]|uniref:Reverse transcriptase RNase H-like domain-containing protein n=1 Tax=Ranitomeya imitator TaxID=111125 RepID=A0ABN9MEP0_9NEOB|nr:unnamed protein product [Ranitomeya imitator]
MKLAFSEWRHLLEGACFPFQVFTDHKNLVYLQTAQRLNSRQARWSLFFSRFHFTLHFLSGEKNIRADALSLHCIICGGGRGASAYCPHESLRNCGPGFARVCASGQDFCTIQFATGGYLLGSLIQGGQDDWASLLPWAEFALNNDVADSTGQTPFLLKYGQHPRVPVPMPVSFAASRVADWAVEARDIWDRTQEAIRASMERMRSSADAHRSPAPTFAPGDLVWLSARNIRLRVESTKFAPSYLGPFKVLEQVNPVVYHLALPPRLGISGTFHVSLLKPVYMSRFSESSAGTSGSSTDDYEVNAILGCKVGRVGFHKTRLSQKSGRMKSADPIEKSWSGIGRNSKPNGDIAEKLMDLQRGTLQIYGRGTCQGVTKTLNFRKAKFDQLRDALNLVDWDNILRTNNTDNKWEMFKNILNRQCKRFIPCGNKRTRNRKNPMWLNKEVRQAINSKKKAFALLKQDGTIEALKNYREKNTLSKKLIKAAKKETEKHIAKESKTNPKLFFNYINSKRIKTENVGPLKNSEERMVVDDEEKANILNTFFSTVFTVENEMLGEIPRNNENPILRVTNLTQEEVRNQLNKIKIDKSPGPDGIHPRVLRELSNKFTFLSNFQYLMIDVAINITITLTMSLNHPAPKLAPYRPPGQLLSPPLLLSIFMQFIFSLIVQTTAFLLVQQQPWYSETDVFRKLHPKHSRPVDQDIDLGPIRSCHITRAGDVRPPIGKCHITDMLSKPFGACVEKIRHCSSPAQYNSNSETWWRQHHASAAGTGRLVVIEGNMNAYKYRDIQDENLFQNVLDLRLGQRFTFKQDNDPKHTAKITKEWLENNSVTILDWPSQSLDLNPIEHHRRDVKMTVHQLSPSNLKELTRTCKE